jgi:hypothetical protein
MPYCRRCGTQLADDAHFCQKCGTPVIATPYMYQTTPARSKPLRNDSLIIGAIVLIAILVVGAVVAALFIASYATVNINQSYKDETIGINKLNLNIQTEALKIIILTQNITQNNNFLVTLDGTASKSSNNGSGNPLQVEFANNTVGDELTITMKITQSKAYSRYNIDCKLYLNADIIRNLNVTSQAGQVSLTVDKPVIFESLNLQSQAGAVQANLANSTIAGNITLRTQAGSIDLRMNEATVEGNKTVALQTNAGSIDMDITETRTLGGNLLVNAGTDLGSVNVGLIIDGDVGARLTSQTNLGSIHTNLQHFSGNQSAIQSDDYPTASNIEVNSKTNLGSININAVYQSSNGPNLRN